MTSPALNRLSSATLNRSSTIQDSVYRPVQSVAELKTGTGRSKSSALNQVYSSTKEDGHQTRYNRQNRKEKRGHHMVAETEINAEGNGL